MKKLPEIIDTYTQVIAAIQSCNNVDELVQCDKFLSSFIMHNDNPDLQIFLSKADAFYKKRYDLLNAPNVNELRDCIDESVEIKVPSITSMKVLKEHVDLCHDGEGGYYYQDPQPSDIC